VKRTSPRCGSKGSLERFLEIQAAYETLLQGGPTVSASPRPRRPRAHAAARTAPGPARASVDPAPPGIGTAGAGAGWSSIRAWTGRRPCRRARPPRARSPQGDAWLHHLRRGGGGGRARLGRRGLVRPGLRHLLDAESEGVRGPAQAWPLSTLPGRARRDPGPARPGTPRPGGRQRGRWTVIRRHPRPRRPIHPPRQHGTAVGRRAGGRGRACRRGSRSDLRVPGRCAGGRWRRRNAARAVSPRATPPARARCDPVRRCGRVHAAGGRRRRGGRDCDGAWSDSGQPPGAVSRRDPGGVRGERRRYHETVSRRASSDLSGAAQEYLLALRSAAVDESRATAATVARHVGVSNPGRQRACTGGSPAKAWSARARARADAHPARPRGCGRHIPSPRPARVAVDQRCRAWLGGVGRRGRAPPGSDLAPRRGAPGRAAGPPGDVPRTEPRRCRDRRAPAGRRVAGEPRGGRRRHGLPDHRDRGGGPGAPVVPRGARADAGSPHRDPGPLRVAGRGDARGADRRATLGPATGVAHPRPPGRARPVPLPPGPRAGSGPADGPLPPRYGRGRVDR